MGLFSGISDALGISSGGVGAIGSLVSGALGFAGQEDTNSANAAQAQSQMDFQERMSDTSYQRAVADMKAAGLNPMLAYSQGGATTPGGAMATMQNSMASAQQASQSFVSQENTRANTEVQRSQADLNAANTVRSLRQATTEGFSAQQVEQMVARLRDQNRVDAMGESMGTAERRRANALGVGAEYDTEASGRALSANQGFRLGESNISANLSRARVAAAGATLDELGEPAARREANWAKSGAGVARPILRDLGSFFGTAASAARMLGGGGFR